MGELGSTANDLGSCPFYGFQKLQKEGSERRFSDPFYECQKRQESLARPSLLMDPQNRPLCFCFASILPGGAELD